jgi:hypothetical protein
MKEISHTLGRNLPTPGTIETECLGDVTCPFWDVAPRLTRRLFLPETATGAFEKVYK